jgi:predicted metalloprotease with PDZ domain
MPAFHHRAGYRLSAWLLVSAWLVNLTWVGAATADATHGPTLKIEVDARDLPRRLLHSRIRVPCQPGKLALWFPKWVPGAHAPLGPVQNVGGLRLETPVGTRLPWYRDELEPYRIECNVPDGLTEIAVRLDTICNQPSHLSLGYLTYGNNSLGIINWGTCLLYPEGFSCDDIQVHVILRFPRAWHYATALKTEQSKDGRASFETLSLTELVDCPLIAGERLQTIALDAGDNPPAFLHLASESKSALNLGSQVVDHYSRVVKQAGALFGACHYTEFHFLVTCSNDLGYFGLEHLRSSVNGVGERDLIEDTRRRGWVAYLLPHEYVHSWCGKFRRPAGICAPDFHTPQKTRLLWVYEGLAQYLGYVLAVRSGLVSRSEFANVLGTAIRTLISHEGRRWRSLEDTAVSSYLLRDHSPNWNNLRRDQDYYDEGMLLWLEADAIIRERSHGKNSLDDFCRKFLGANTSTANVVPYELPEIVATLRELADFDWGTFLERRVAQPQEELPLDVLGRCGYHFRDWGQGFVSQATRQSYAPFIWAAVQDSIGLKLDTSGRITDVVPGMSSDRAGLAPGMKVISVNDHAFNRERLVDALLESVERQRIDVRLIEGTVVRMVSIDYSEGIRYFVLARDESKPDVLAQILSPLTGGPKTKSSPSEINPGRLATVDVSTRGRLQQLIGVLASGTILVAGGLAMARLKKARARSVPRNG